MAQLAQGNADEQDRRSAARHMMSCSDCAEEFRVARSTRLWTEQFGPASEPSQPPARHWLRVIFSTPRLAYALAAASLIIAVSLAAWVATLRRETSELQAKVDQQSGDLDRATAASRSLDEARRELEAAVKRNEQYRLEIDDLSKRNEDLSLAIEDAPQASSNAFIADIRPDDSVRSDAGRARIIEVPFPSYAGVIAINMTLSEQPSHASYEMEIFNQPGNLLRRVRNLKVTEDGTCTVSVPARLMPGGESRIKFYGIGRGARTIVEDYRVRIRRNR
jgi:hypothetical protein